MSRRLVPLLLALFLLPGLVLAQQSQPAQSQPPAAKKPAPKVEKQEAQPQQPANDNLQYTPSSVAPKPDKSPTPPSAPKPGHPLDQADVDVLTGKNKPQQQGYGWLVDPYMYGNTSTFTTPGQPGSRFTTPAGYGGYDGGTFISPLAIGRRNGQGFVVVGGNVGNMPFVASFPSGNFTVFFRPGFRFF